MSRILPFLFWLSSAAAPPDSAPGGQDWPAWRGDARRSGSTSHELPEKLHLQWVRDLPPLTPAWPDQTRLQFDVAYEPVAAGRTLFVPSSRADGVTAYDTRTGEEKWVYFANGPVRFSPVVWEGRVYFGSDDGYLYCLDAEKGALLWNFRGGPSDRKVLGNGRLISTWPVRGAPVVADGVVYFAASIWPFMGTFLHALDARTGKVVWTNDGDGSLYIKQPHMTEAFAGVAPQGPLAVAGDFLLVPGGRSTPACYDRRNGKLVHFKIAENNRRGGYDVAVGGRVVFCGGSGVDLSSGLGIADLGRPLVVSEDTVYYGGKSLDVLFARIPEVSVIEAKDSRGKPVSRAVWKMDKPRSVETPRVESLIKAGKRLYAGADKKVLAIELDPRGKGGKVVGQLSTETTPLVLLAADDRLFAVTKDGRIRCFGGAPTEPVVHAWKPVPASAGFERQEWGRRLADASGVSEGYALVWGESDPGILAGIAERTQLRLVAVDANPDRVQAARTSLVAAGLYGERVSVLEGDPASLPLPPYFASVVFAPEDFASVPLPRAFAVLRPYGGKLLAPVGSGRRGDVESRVRDAGLEGGVPEEGRVPGFLAVSRPGPLPGAGSWTHEHGDASNTRVSKDARVKAPLGLLWFGGSSHEGILPRHGHGPQPQVLDGRIFIEGVDMLRAMDVYTGRVLWEARLPGVGRLYNNTSHQPGANASGTNFISTTDGIYVACGRTCVRLDPATGRKVSEFALPSAAGQKDPPVWGYINVVGDLLIGGAEPLLPSDPKKPELGSGDDPDDMDDLFLRRLLALRGDQDAFSSSKRLVVLDRKSGAVLWSVAAESGFRHNAVCAGGGRLYCVDRLSGPQVSRLKKKGETNPAKPRLLAFDLKTGREVWRSDREIFGTWLSYSAERDILVEAGRVARDTISDEPKGMRAWRADDGTALWFKKDLVGPAMIQDDTIVMSDRACDLLSGALRARAHPLTGQTVPWTWTRNHGCNTPMVARHVMTFRSGAAGFYDLAGDGGTGNFGGFRSSCTNNLVVADGVLAAPDYTRTCTCSYQNQTSVGLVPMPDNEMWTFFGSTDVKGPIRRVGINLGAAGDRRAEDGMLWLEYPSVAGRSPSVSVSVSGDKVEWFRRHASRVEGPFAWVGSSGAKGLKSLTVPLDKDGAERSFTVRLHFVEPDGLGPGERVFGVTVNGREVLADFDVAQEAGGPWRSVVKEFRGVAAKKELKVGFSPRKGAAVLCGVEVVEEGAPAVEVPTVLPADVAPPPPPDLAEPLLRPADAGDPEEPEPVSGRIEGWMAAAGAGLVLVLLLVWMARRKQHALV